MNPAPTTAKTTPTDKFFRGYIFFFSGLRLWQSIPKTHLMGHAVANHFWQAAGPSMKRGGVVVNDLYDQLSLLKTMELILKNKGVRLEKRKSNIKIPFSSLTPLSLFFPVNPSHPSSTAHN